MRSSTNYYNYYIYNFNYNNYDQQTTATRPTLVSLPPSQFFLVSSSSFFLPGNCLPHMLFFFFDNAQREMHPLKLTACLLGQRHAHVYVHMKRHRGVPFPTKNMRGEQLMRNTMLQHFPDQRKNKTARPLYECTGTTTSSGFSTGTGFPTQPRQDSAL